MAEFALNSSRWTCLACTLRTQTLGRCTCNIICTINQMRPQKQAASLYVKQLDTQEYQWMCYLRVYYFKE